MFLLRFGYYHQKFYLILLSQHCVACVTVLYSSLSLFVFTAFAGDY